MARITKNKATIIGLFILFSSISYGQNYNIYKESNEISSGNVNLIIGTNVTENLLSMGPNILIELRYKVFSFGILASRKFGRDEVSYSKNYYTYYSDPLLWSPYSLVRKMNGYGVGTEFGILNIEKDIHVKLQYYFRYDWANQLTYKHRYDDGVQSDYATINSKYSDVKRFVNIFKFLIEFEIKDIHPVYYTVFGGVGLRHIRTKGVRYYEEIYRAFNTEEDFSVIQHNEVGKFPSIHFGMRIGFKV